MKLKDEIKKLVSNYTNMIAGEHLTSAGKTEFIEDATDLLQELFEQWAIRIVLEDFDNISYQHNVILDKISKRIKESTK